MSVGTAIKSRWESAGMASRVPGGLWQEKAPTGVIWPYQTFLIISQSFQGRTSTSIQHQASFEIHTFYKPIEGEDPQEAVNTLLDLIETAFDDQVLTVEGFESMIVTQNDRRTFEEDFQVYRGLNEFNFKLQKSR